jgi:hypothetical protein
MADKGEGLGDEQGTKIGAADQKPSATPAPHNDGPSDRPERSTGAGREATAADPNSEEHDREHRSGYGGKGGSPDTSSDKR